VIALAGRLVVGESSHIGTGGGWEVADLSARTSTVRTFGPRKGGRNSTLFQFRELDSKERSDVNRLRISKIHRFSASIQKRDRCRGAPRDDRVEIYLRGPEGVSTEADRFEPFVLLEEQHSSRLVRQRALRGSGGFLDYRTVAFFRGWKALQNALKHLSDVTGRPWGTGGALLFRLRSGSAVSLQLRPNPIQGHALRRHRAAPDRYRDDGHGRVRVPSAQREGDRITLVSLSDSSGWERSLRGDRLSEPQMLAELERLMAIGTRT